MSLAPINEQLTRAITVLKTRPEGQLFFEWLARSADETRATLTYLDDEKLIRREQGAAQLLDSVNGIIGKA